MPAAYALRQRAKDTFSDDARPVDDATSDDARTGAATPHAPGRSRRTVVHTLAAAALACTGLVSVTGVCAETAAAANRTLRIGYQKYGTLTLLKARGDLEKRLAPQGVTVRWTEFPAGPQLLEGLNVGSIDFGTVGEAPPIFAQAAGAPFVYVAHQPPAPSAEAIVVAKDSSIKSVADLRGKTIALNKGSNVHYLLLKALEKAGVPYGAVQTVFLPPADARAAFERGSVDAWAIWDPFLAAAQAQLGVRVLTDGNGLVANHQFYLAARPYADAQPAVVAAIVDELARLDRWAAGDPKAVAQLLAPQVGLPLAVTELASNRFAYGIQAITPQVAAAQQQVADAFFALKLIPKAVKVIDALPTVKTSVAAQ